MAAQSPSPVPQSSNSHQAYNRVVTGMFDCENAWELHSVTNVDLRKYSVTQTENSSPELHALQVVAGHVVETVNVNNLTYFLINSS